MATYYFHIQKSDEILIDECGTDLPDFNAAKIEAFQAAREILGEAVRFGLNSVPESIVIADSEGRQLLSVPLYLALPEQLRR